MKNLSFIRLIILAVIVFAQASTMAEYRVYQYYVKSKLQQPIDANSYLVTSTLDPVSYLSYHGGNSSIRVDLLRSWMCKGHTGNYQTACNGPEENSGAIIRQ